ncbi:hypothetical protein AA0116_g12505 [Alternaria tenuissima]|nr:hypothetical protein AA0116_g12505 [Alternaria tenuissima]
MVKLLINAGADVNAPTPNCQWGNALQTASAEGHTEIVELLLNAHAAINAQNERHETALHAAIIYASPPEFNESVVNLLLKRGADCDLNKRLKGPIHYAADNRLCTLSLVSMLQQHGASVDAIDANNMTPLHYCVKSGHEKIAEYLLDAGVPIDIGIRRKSWPGDCDTSSRVDRLNTMHPTPESVAVGLTSLHFAALTGNPTMTQFLLNHGANPNALSEYGETPLHLNQRTKLYGRQSMDSWTDEVLRVENKLIRCDHCGDCHKDFSNVASVRECILHTLLAHPNTSTAAQDYQGENLLHCIEYGKLESVTLVQRFLSRGADPLCVNPSQKSPLHLAIEAHDTASLIVLLRTGADALGTEKRLLNAIDYAVRHGNHQAIVAILEMEEARALKLVTTKDENGQNLLHRLFWGQYVRIETVQWLLDEGADSSELDDSGVSPLARLIQNYLWYSNIEEICSLLLKIEGNASFVDCYGQGLGHLYAASPNSAIFQTFNDHGVDLAKRDCAGRTVLHSAARSGSLTEGTLEFLLDVIGIQINEEDTHGRTALQYATEEASNDHGSDIMIPERWERTRDVLLKHQADRKN